MYLLALSALAPQPPEFRDFCEANRCVRRVRWPPCTLRKRGSSVAPHPSLPRPFNTAHVSLVARCGARHFPPPAWSALLRAPPVCSSPTARVELTRAAPLALRSPVGCAWDTYCLLEVRACCGGELAWKEACTPALCSWLTLCACRPLFAAFHMTLVRRDERWTAACDDGASVQHILLASFVAAPPLSVGKRSPLARSRSPPRTDLHTPSSLMEPAVDPPIVHDLLPDALMTEIFIRLDSRTRAHCALVCSTWRTLLSRPECWICLSLPLQPADNLHSAFDRSSSERRLWLCWQDVLSFHWNKSLTVGRSQLKCIDFSGQLVDEEQLVRFLELPPQSLQTLRLGLLGRWIDLAASQPFGVHGLPPFASSADLRLLRNDIPGPSVLQTEKIISRVPALQRLHLSTVFCYSDDPKTATLLRREPPFEIVSIDQLVILFERERKQHVEGAEREAQFAKFVDLLPRCGCRSLRLWRAPLHETHNLELLIAKATETSSLAEMLLDGCNLSAERAAPRLEELLSTHPHLRVSVNCLDSEERTFLSLNHDGRLGTNLLDDYEAGVDWSDSDGVSEDVPEHYGSD